MHDQAVGHEVEPVSLHVPDSRKLNTTPVDGTSHVIRTCGCVGLVAQPFRTVSNRATQPLANVGALTRATETPACGFNTVNAKFAMLVVPLGKLELMFTSVTFVALPLH